MPTGLVKLIFGVVLFALFCMGAPTAAQADNLIVNPGFEDWSGSDFTSWNEYNAWTRTSDAHSGSWAVLFGPTAGSVVSNRLTNPELGMYEFGVWFRLYYEAPLSYDAAVINAYVVPWTGLEFPLYQQYETYAGNWTVSNGGFISDWFLLQGTFQLTAPVTALEVVLALHNNTSAYKLAYADDAYLRRVPEPATLALLGLGLIGVGVTLRRRRR